VQERTSTLVVVLTALLWAAVTAMGWAGLGFEAMFVGLALLSAYLFQGVVMRRGRVGWRMLAFPVLPWLVLWSMSFGLSRYHAEAFGGVRPDFTILGLHPSFAWTVLTYWVGGVLTLSVGFALRRDDWLSEAEWEAFRRRVASEGDGEATDVPGGRAGEAGGEGR
jgi:hypothetical protein